MLPGSVTRGLDIIVIMVVIIIIIRSDRSQSRLAVKFTAYLHFLPDPGVSGVRSMGPGVSMSVREL